MGVPIYTPPVGEVWRQRKSEIQDLTQRIQGGFKETRKMRFKERLLVCSSSYCHTRMILKKTHQVEGTSVLGCEHTSVQPECTPPAPPAP